MALSDLALLKYPWKIIRGVHPYSNYTSLLFPNCSTLSGDLVPWHNDSNLFGFHLDWSLDPEELNGHLWKEDCGSGGCLFNVAEDPNETNNLAAAEPQLLAELSALLTEANKGMFLPDRGDEVVEACANSVNIGGYYGPFVGVEDYYTGPFRDLKWSQDLLSDAYIEFLSIVAHPRLEVDIWKVVQQLYPKFMRPPLVNSFDWCLDSNGERVPDDDEEDRKE